MSAPGENLSLLPTTTAAAREIGAVPGAMRSAQLWLALSFPGLPLDALAGAANDRPSGLAVIAEERGRYTVAVADEEAGRYGVHPGLALNAAYALLPALVTLARDPERERARLKRLAGWSGQFTSQVGVVEPDALLLEVFASRKLFGGVSGVVQVVRDGLARLAIEHRYAVSPTPLSALWLARAGRDDILRSDAELRATLGKLPIEATRWPDKLLTTLHGMGVRTVRDCLRLPRAGFSRRFGRARLHELDRALGASPDPVRCHRPPDRFRADLELPAEMHDLALIEHAAGRLLDELAGFLRVRQAGVDALHVVLTHQDVAATTVRVGLASPSRDAQRLRRVLHERLESIALPAPVLAVALEAPLLVPLSGRDGELFARDVSSYDWPQLVERLRARLGVESVHGLCLVPEHRPEAAWRYVDPGATGEGERVRRRPLWMLSEPVQLAVWRGRPCHDGELRILNGPERIETGWWDGRDIARDYYVAVNPAALYLWIYRRRRAPRDWYLHGVFG